MRCFIAIELPAGVRERLMQLSARLRRCPVRASWVHGDHVHLTLRFLGDVTDDACNAVRTDLRNRVAAAPSFELHVQGAGAFPNLRKPSVIWAGAGPLAGALERVQALCEAAAQGIGLAREPRPFHPHITLARVKDFRPPAGLEQAIERERMFTAGEFVVPGVSLFQSALTPRGPVYTRLEEFRFT